MKVRIEIQNELSEDEVVIHCRELNEEVTEIQKAVLEKQKEFAQLLLSRDKTEYYCNVMDILFFETSGEVIEAHTKTEVFETALKLYELENLLPTSFMRISKSSIVNLTQIYSITRNVTASSEISFYDTYKQVYVSRNYYKSLKARLEEERLRK